MRRKLVLLIIVLSMFGAIATSVIATPVVAHASDVETCYYGSGVESSYQFCGISSLASGYMKSLTKPNRSTCTVTVWEYYIPTNSYITYAQQHYVGGVTLYTVLVNGDTNSSHYLQGNFWQRCDGSYAFSGWWAFGG